MKKINKRSYSHVFVTAIVFLLLSTTGKAQTLRTWSGTTGGDWSTPANWTPNGIPSATDTIVINTSPMVIISVPTVTIKSLNISGTAVTLTPASTDTLTITDVTIISVGDSLTIGSNLTIAIGSTFSNNGSLVGPGTALFNFDTNIPQGVGSGGTFSSTTPISIADNGGGTLTLFGTLLIEDLTLATAFGLDIDTNDLIVQGNISCTGGASITGFTSITMTGTSKTLFGDGGLLSLNSFLIIAGAVSVTGSIEVNKLTINSGFGLTVAGGNTLTLSGNFSNSGTMTGPGTIEFTSFSNIPEGIGSGGTFSSVTPLNLTLTGASVSATTNITIADVTINSGAALDINSNTLTVKGNLSYFVSGFPVTGIAGSTILMTGAQKSINGNGGTGYIAPVLTVSTSDTVTAVGNIYLHALTISSGSLIIGSGDTLTMDGIFTNNAQLIGPGAIQFNSTSNNIPGGSGTFSSNAPVSIIANATTLTLTSAITVTDLNVISGTLDLVAGNLTVKGNLSFSGSGKITATGGFVTMSGAAVTMNGNGSANPIPAVVIGATASITGNTNITDLTINPAASLTISSGDTCVIGGSFSNSGTIVGPGTVQFSPLTVIPAGAGSGGTFSTIAPVTLISSPHISISDPITIADFTVHLIDTISIDASDLTVLGDATLDGYILGAGNLTFSGSTEQLIFGSGGTVNNLVINNDSGVTLDPTNVNIGNSLTFLGGNLNTGPVNEVLANYASPIISTSTTGWINGTLELNGLPVSGDASMSFQVGGATWYDPVDLDLHGLTGTSGSFSAATAGGSVATSLLVASPLDSAKSIKRSWKVSNLGTTFDNFDLTLNYNTGEIPAAAVQTNFVIAQTDDGGFHWSLHAGGSIAGIGTQAIALIYNSDFVVGEVDCNKALPALSTTVTNVSTTGGTDGAIHLVANSAYGPFKYKWSGVDSVMSLGDTAFSINNLPEGIYTITVTTVGGCVATHIDTVKETPVAISKIENENSFRVWPNPAHDKLNVAFSNTGIADCRIKLTDILGHSVLSRELSIPEIQNHFLEIDISALKPGIYILSLDLGEASEHLRILVE